MQELKEQNKEPSLMMADLNRLRICVDQQKDNTLQGEFFHALLGWRSFSTIWEAIDKTEDLLQQLDYPQAALQVRSFLRRAKPHASEERDAWLRAQAIRNDLRRELFYHLESEKNRTGKLATFCVIIQFRQNATWQGSVKWMEEQRQVCFRSALELVKLIQNVMPEKRRRNASTSVKGL